MSIYVSIKTCCPGHSPGQSIRIFGGRSRVSVFQTSLGDSSIQLVFETVGEPWVKMQIHIQQIWDGTESAFLANAQVLSMLLVHGLCFEKQGPEERENLLLSFEAGHISRYFKQAFKSSSSYLQTCINQHAILISLFSSSLQPWLGRSGDHSIAHCPSPAPANLKLLCQAGAKHAIHHHSFLLSPFWSLANNVRYDRFFVCKLSLEAGNWHLPFPQCSLCILLSLGPQFLLVSCP